MQLANDKQLVGAAGEHLVLSRLLARDLLASQAPRGTRKADILVNPLDGGKPRLIQVKTRSPVGKSLGWHMGVKHEDMSERDLFYCFVNLDLLVPSHAEWLATPGQKGQKHNETDMRRIMNDYGKNFKSVKPGWMDKYLEAWDLLE